MDTKLSYKTKIALSILILIVAAGLNFIASEFIQTTFPNRLPASDLLFVVLPYISWTQYVSSFAAILSPLTLLIYYIVVKNKQFHWAILSFASVYALRAFLIILTPLGGPNGNMAKYGIATIMQHGEFPSGHTALVITAVMLITAKTKTDKIFKTILIILAIAEIAALLLSHGHYSVDIVGGYLITYLVINEINKYRTSKSSVLKAN